MDFSDHRAGTSIEIGLVTTLKELYQNFNNEDKLLKLFNLFLFQCYQFIGDNAYQLNHRWIFEKHGGFLAKANASIIWCCCLEDRTLDEIEFVNKYNASDRLNMMEEIKNWAIDSGLYEHSLLFDCNSICEVQPYSNRDNEVLNLHSRIVQKSQDNLKKFYQEYFPTSIDEKIKMVLILH